MFLHAYSSLIAVCPPPAFQHHTIQIKTLYDEAAKGLGSLYGNEEEDDAFLRQYYEELAKDPMYGDLLEVSKGRRS